MNRLTASKSNFTKKKKKKIEQPSLDTVVFLLCWCFTALRHFSGHFGWGQLTYQHWSWASLLCSLPILRAHSFPSNWQLPFLNQRKGGNGHRNYFMWDQSPRKKVAGHEDQTRDRPHTRRMHIRPTSRKLLRIKVTPDLHLTYSKNGGNLGLVLKMKNIACISILLTKHVKYTYLYLFKFVLYSIVAFKAN